MSKYDYSYPPVKFSRAWLSMKIDCTPEGRKICKGGCCKHKSMRTNGRYTKREYEFLPTRIRRIVQSIDDEYYVPVDKNGCVLIEECLSNPANKPLQCWLSPLKVSPNELLIVNRWVNLFCPNKGKGTPIYVSLEREIKYVWGGEFYEKLKNYMKKEGFIKRRDLNDLFAKREC